MAASFPFFQATSPLKLHSNTFTSSKHNNVKFGTTIKCCSSSNGREQESADSGVKRIEKLLEEKRRAELSACIASGEFTVGNSGVFWQKFQNLLWGRA